MIRGADIVVRSLIAENAEFIFGYPGRSNHAGL
jgi:acetolactate synthase I/II/III large subunit